MIRNFLSVSLVLLLCFSPYSSFAHDMAKDTTTKVICSLLTYIWQFGGPLITMVIIGSAILAIFGKMQWSALVALAIFTSVFFGATKIVEVFTSAVNPSGSTAARVYICSTDITSS